MPLGRPGAVLATRRQQAEARATAGCEVILRWQVEVKRGHNRDMGAYMPYQTTGIRGRREEGERERESGGGHMPVMVISVAGTGGEAKLVVALAVAVEIS